MAHQKIHQCINPFSRGSVIFRLQKRIKSILHVLIVNHNYV